MKGCVRRCRQSVEHIVKSFKLLLWKCGLTQIWRAPWKPWSDRPPATGLAGSVRWLGCCGMLPAPDDQDESILGMYLCLSCHCSRLQKPCISVPCLLDDLPFHALPCLSVSLLLWKCGLPQTTPATWFGWVCQVPWLLCT